MSNDDCRDRFFTLYGFCIGVIVTMTVVGSAIDTWGLVIHR